LGGRPRTRQRKMRDEFKKPVYLSPVLPCWGFVFREPLKVGKRGHQKRKDQGDQSVSIIDADGEGTDDVFLGNGWMEKKKSEADASKLWAKRLGVKSLFLVKGSPLSVSWG